MQYEIYIKKCIELARKGEGQTSPNPLVGCIILDKSGNEIAAGYHAKYGENHAERNALLKIDKGEGHTLIVNLEPCSHYGKTPPCADFIIEKGIKKVVMGMVDPNPIVSGRGIKKLKDAGIEVITGICEDDCRKLNEVFIKNMVENKTFVAIKTASTLDGKTASSSGSSKWITSDTARNEVKNIRNRYDAILTTSSTILADNPSMKHRKKIILDRTLKTDLSSSIYQTGEIYLFNAFTDKFVHGINFIKTPVKEEKLDIDFVLQKAYELGIKSILVESGGHFSGAILSYADKIYHFIAPKIAGDNSSLSCFDFRHITDINECIKFKFDEIKTYNQDILLVYSKI